MSENKLTLRQVEMKIKAVDGSIGTLKEKLEKLNADKKALQAEKRRLSAARTAAAKKAAAKKATAKKTTVKKTAAKKTTAKKAPARKTAAKKAAARKDENLLDGLMDGLKQAGLNPEDLLKSILGGK